jgi:hypothetical protein
MPRCRAIASSAAFLSWNLTRYLPDRVSRATLADSGGLGIAEPVRRLRTAGGVAVVSQPALPLNGAGSPPPNCVIVAILYQIDPDLSMTMC